MSYNQQGRGNIHENGVRQIYSRKVGTLTIHKEQTDTVLCCLTKRQNLVYLIDISNIRSV